MKAHDFDRLGTPAFQRQLQDAVNEKIAPMELLGDVSWYPEVGEWRALVAVYPTGPMILVSLGLTFDSPMGYD